MSLSKAEIAYEQAHLYQDQRPVIIAVVAVFCGIAVATTIARLFSRWYQATSYALDDYFMIPGTILTIVNIVAVCFEAHYGYGEHLIAINPENFLALGKWETVNLWSYIFSITFIKLSILALIYRIFNGQQNKVFTWAVYFLVAWVLVWLVALCFAFGFECQPFSSQWSLTDRCTPPLALDYSATILNSVHDVAIFVLPQRSVWKLHIPLRKKLTVSIIFMIGIVATLMGIFKIIFLTGIPGSSHPEDGTFNITAAAIFTSMEPILAIICGNLPAMPTLFQKLQTSQVAQSISHALSRLVSGTTSRGSASAPDTYKDRVGSSDDNSKVIITSGWEVSKQKLDSDVALEDLKREAVPFAEV